MDGQEYIRNWIPYYLKQPLISFTLWKLVGKILTFQYILLSFYWLFLNENGHGTHGYVPEDVEEDKEYY